MRLDIYLQNLKDISRAKAQALIKGGNVFVDGKNITKCGFEVDNSHNIQIVGGCQYVSRAGLKLEGACREFGVCPADMVVLDIGSSTGGFSDYCLQNGAKKVYCVDVGNNQLDKKIRDDKRVVVMENTDIRNARPQDFLDVDLVVCDVSFISLTKISQQVAQIMNESTIGIFLVKPQFECGKELAKKYKGVIKDSAVHKKVIQNVKEDFLSKGICVQKISTSVIKGNDGNTEFLFFVKKV